MKHIGQILLERDEPDERIAHAVADAFGVDSATVWPRAQVMDETADILVQRAREDGDFRVLLSITATPASGIHDGVSEDRFLKVVRTLARALDQSILTDEIGVEFDDDFLVITPSGETLVVIADDDGLSEGRIELTPESRRRWANLLASTPVSAAD